MYETIGRHVTSAIAAVLASAFLLTPYEFSAAVGAAAREASETVASLEAAVREAGDRSPDHAVAVARAGAAA